MSRPSLRVYFIRHENGFLTGRLVRQWSSFFGPVPPAAYASSEEEVLSHIEQELRRREADEEDALSDYLWNETFTVKHVNVDVHPQGIVKKRSVIGKKRVRLRLCYLVSQPEGGGHRVLLPRFGWTFVLEDLATAPTVLGNAVSAALLGEKPRWVYEFRNEGEEYVLEWTPDFAADPKRLTPDITPRTPFPTLESVADELVEQAAKRRLPPLFGRRTLDPRERDMLQRDPPPSLLVIGEPGSGKTAWVRALADEILRWKQDGKHAPRIWRTSADRILAGMIYLGQWEKRCLDLVHELSHEGDYLYLERLTPILRPQVDGTSIGDILLPALQAGEISVIAECTDAELVHARHLSPSFVGQLKVVRIRAVTAAEAAPLLAQYLEKRAPALEIHPAASRRALQYLERFDRHLAFPGKAFRFGEWLVRQEARGQTRTLRVPEISEAFARYSGLPLAVVADEVPATAASIAEALGAGVIGQSEACDTCGRVIARLKAGLNDPEKPVASLFFVGPTGVGKTELAKQLSRYLYGDEGRLVRIDMSEYMLAGSQHRLLETGPGVRSLAEQVRHHPLCVVLLDEIEKADPEVFDLLLGVLGEGRLTDDNGRLVDFRMTVIVMTSNLGTQDGAPPGFGDSGPGGTLGDVRRHFRPEFWNRLDHVIPFRRLSPADVRRVVELELGKLSRRVGLVRRGITLEVDSAAKDLLAERGYHPTRGARPLQRTIEQLVVAPLSKRLAAFPALRDYTFRVSAADGEIVIG
jgi:ATP-dependent Clp protease ATP-binding subunit ClpC